MEGCAQGLGPHETLYNRFIRGSRLGLFDRIFATLAVKTPKARAHHDRLDASEGASHGGYRPHEKAG